MKKVAGGMKLDLAQFRSLEAFAQFGSDLDAATKRQIDRGRRLTELLKQPQYASQSFEEQAVVIYAAGKGFLDNVPVEKVKEYEKGLVAFLKERATSLMDTLLEKAAYDDTTEPKLKDAIADYTNNYFGK